MAKRLNQSEAWLSRYLDLARFHPDLIGAFPDPFELKISHVVTLKPLLKGDGSRASVMEEARRLKADREAGTEGQPATVPEVLRLLVAVAGRQAEKPTPRSEERREGTEGVSTCRSRLSPYAEKQK